MNICRHDKRMLRASATVEAAFVVPIVIFVIVAIIFLCGFLYNRIRLGMGMEECLFSAQERLGLGCSFSESEIEREFLEANPQSAFFWCRAVSADCRIQDKKVTLEAGLELALPTEGLTGRLADGLRVTKQSADSEYRDRAKIQRRLAAAGKLLKRFKQ